MRTYELVETSDGESIKVTEGEREIWIPFDPANSDYQAYLAWVAEGNEAEQENN